MKREEKELRLIQWGMYRGDLITSTDREELNKIQNEKAKEFLEKHHDAVVGKILWNMEKDKNYPFLKDKVPLGNFSFNFAIPKRMKMLELAIKSYNEMRFEPMAIVNAVDRINIWIKKLGGIQFFWL